MQFIKVYDNALSEGLMQELRDWADISGTHLKFNGADQYEGGTLSRHDHQKFLRSSNPELMLRCNNELGRYVEEYVNTYPCASGAISYDVKLQKTPIKGGYSIWHAEQCAGGGATRSLSWMVYLNDVEVGGETEFLYQGFKQKAKKGTLVIWPAAFTHTHRGNPPYSNEKYVITGWGQFPYETEVE